MNKNNKLKSLFILCLIAVLFSPILRADISILPLEKRAQVINRWLKTRLEKVLPGVMRREK